MQYSCIYFKESKLFIKLKSGEEVQNIYYDHYFVINYWLYSWKLFQTCYIWLDYKV